MSQHDELDKSCPILAAAASGGSNVSTGAYWASRCKREGCGWWDDQRNACAVVSLSQELREIVTAGLRARVA